MRAQKLLDYNATLCERIDLTGDLAIFRFALDRRRDAPWFRAGQYVTVGLNNTRTPTLGSVRRAMSIASPPQQINTVDIYARYVNQPESDNPLTALLWRMKVHDRCFVRDGAAGRFTLAETLGKADPRLKIFIAAGTGLAPFVSIAEDLTSDSSVRLDDCAILHGVSHPNDLGYRAKLQSLVATRGLRYLPTVSRPAQAPEWSGATGRVEDFFHPQRLELTEQLLGLGPSELNAERCAVLICGLQGTIRQTLERLLHRGFVPHERKLRKALSVEHIAPVLFWEQYDNTPIFNTKDALECARLRALLGT